MWIDGRCVGGLLMDGETACRDLWMEGERIGC